MNLDWLFPKPTTGVARIIKLMEGCRLAAYQDTGGVWTIGWGHTRGVKPGQRITPEQAERYLQQDIDVARAIVAKHVTRQINRDQRDALISFVFNIGETQFARSTLLRHVNAGRLAEAVEELPRWVHDDGRVLPGLVVRRAVEAFVWHGKGDAIDPPTLKALRAMV